MSLSARVRSSSLVDSSVAAATNTYFSLHRIFKKKTPDNPKRILFVSLHRIGDTVFTIPALRAALQFYKDAEASIVCFSHAKAVYQKFFPEVQFLILEKQELRKGRFASTAARKKLHALKPDVIFDITGDITSAMLIYDSPSFIAGMNQKYFRSIYDKYTEPRKDTHLMRMYYEAIALLVPGEVNEEIFKFPFVPVSSNKILVHPNAGWHAKEWSLLRFIGLCKNLVPEYSVEFISESKHLPEDVAVEIEKLGMKVSVDNTIEAVLQKIEESFLFISNDSGPLYLASMMGKPTFTIYGPTNPRYSVPFGEHHRFIRRQLDCSPVETQYCANDAGRICSLVDCMAKLSVDEVSAALTNFLQQLKK